MRQSGCSCAVPSSSCAIRTGIGVKVEKRALMTYRNLVLGIFLIGCTAPPPRVQLISPISGSLILGRRPTLTWKGSPNAQYLLEVCSSVDCHEVVYSKLVIGVVWQVDQDLPAQAVFWRVTPQSGNFAQSFVWEMFLAANGSSHVAGAVMDLNLNGIPDIYLPGSSVILRDQSDWIDLPRLTYDPRQSARGPFGDINGDGYPDLVVASFSGYPLEVYWGKAAGFSELPDLVFEPPTGPPAYRMDYAGDLNRDGYGDLVFRTAYNVATSVLYGSPDEHWLAGPTLPVPYYYNVYGHYEYLKNAGDVNGDGYPDLLLGNGCLEGLECPPGSSEDCFSILCRPNALVVYLSGQTGFDGPYPLVDPNPDSTVNDGAAFGYNQSAGGDLNGDGYDDIVIGVPYAMSAVASRILVFWGGPKGPSVLPTVISSTAYQMLLAPDLNGDGLSDLLLSEDGVVRTFLGTASADLQEAPRGPAGDSFQPTSDLNGDGIFDVVSAHGSSVDFFLASPTGVNWSSSLHFSQP